MEQKKNSQGRGGMVSILHIVNVEGKITDMLMQFDISLINKSDMELRSARETF